MKISTCVLLLLLAATSFTSFSQTVFSTETFSTAFNTNYTSPINQGFYEDIGKWIAYSSDSYAAVAVDGKQFASSPYALKLFNGNTSKGTKESISRATGPIVPCTTHCITFLQIQFKLFALAVDPSNTTFSFHLDVSKDNGTTWTTVLAKSPADIISAYGSNKWSDVAVSVPTDFFTTSFRYRFIGIQQAGSNFDNSLYIDDVNVSATDCTPVANLTLGNQVWNDKDGDGKRDTNEPGIGGVTVSLYTDNNSDNLPDGAAIATTQTDANGVYHFTNLAPGRYIASMPILPGYQKSPNTSTQATSPFPDNNIDDDNNLVNLVGVNGPGGTLYTNAITLTAGQEPEDNGNTNNTLDLAECGNSGIGDFVWNDLNGNGIQDAGEPGINGVKVTITFTDGRFDTVLTQTYNAPNNANAPQYDGYYNFINLGPGNYKLTFATPAGFNPSPGLQGSDRAKDSNPADGTGTTTTTITANQSDFTIDAGFTKYTAPPPPVCPNLSLGNTVFIDLNDNGTKEFYEPGIGGLTVKLYADNDGNNVPDGAAVSTVTTACDGTYYFGNLSAGKYIVGVTLVDSLTQGSNGSTTPDDDKDNDNNGVRIVNGEVQSNFITLASGTEPVNDGSDNNSNMTLDFGLKLKSNPFTHSVIVGGECTLTTNNTGYFGGFEAGSVNFSTGTGKTDLRYGLPRNGSFEVVSKASDAGGGGYLDITPHSGNAMMLIHTSSDASERLWSATVNVVPGKTYNICTWVANAKTDPVNGFALTLNAGDKVIAKGNVDFNWSKFCATYTVPQGVTSIEFSIKDPYPEIAASHFLALDDICISEADNSLTGSLPGSVSNSPVKNIYPNPAGKTFNLTIHADKQGTASVRLINTTGRTIFTKEKQVLTGDNTFTFNVNDITGGIYNVQVILGDQPYNQTLVISR